MGLISAVLSARALREDDRALVRELRDERGIIAGQHNAGQLALADWFIRLDHRKDERGGAFVNVVGYDTTIRLLTGEIVPDAGLANMVAELTEGAVRPMMFELPALEADETPAADTAARAAGRAADPSPPKDWPPVEVPISGALTLARTRHSVFLSGGGWTVQFDPSELASLHAGLGAMLAI